MTNAEAFQDVAYRDSVSGIISEVLKWMVLASVLAGSVEVLENRRHPPRKHIYWTLLDLALLAVSVGSAVAASITALFWDFSMAPTAGVRDAAANLAVTVGLVVLIIVFVRRHLRGLGPPAFPCMVFGLLVIAFTSDAISLNVLLTTREEITISEVELQGCLIVVIDILAVLTVGGVFFSALRDQLVWGRDSGKPCESSNEDTRCRLAVLFNACLMKHFKNNLMQRKVVESSLAEPSQCLRCRPLVTDLVESSERKRKAPPKPGHFILAMFRTLWFDMFWVFLITFAYYACLFCKVPLLESLIGNVSHRPDESVTSVVFIFVAVTIAEVTVSCHQLYALALFSIRVRSMLQGSIFRKVTRLSPTSRAGNPPGFVLALLTVDCAPIVVSAYQFPQPISGFLCMPFAFYMLAQRAGSGSALCTALAFFILAVVTVPLSRIQKSLWNSVMKCRDERLKRMTDLLSSVRVVKMYAWEGAYLEMLKSLRVKEMAAVFRVNLLDGLIDSVYSGLSSLMTLIFFGALAALDPTRTLDPQFAFSCIYLISLMDTVTSSCSQLLRTRSLLSLSLRRISKFCTEEEEEEESTGKDNALKKGEIVLENCSFAWSKRSGESSKATLKGITVRIGPGSHVGVAGFVGSGKSSLLSAILGDMHCVEGSMKKLGSIAYLPQAPPIYNMTIRDNILFGKKFEVGRYRRVLQACELLDDLNQFPGGDSAQVGEKGETLSGGQKQRVALARAAYSRSSIYLLDDPLSSLDPYVGARVFKQVLGRDGLLKDKTLVVVSNQGSVLKEMDQLLLMDGTTAHAYKSCADLINDARAPKTIGLGSTLAEKNPSSHYIDTQYVDDGAAGGKVTQDENTAATKSELQIAMSLGSMGGIGIVPSVLFFVVSSVAFSGQLLWIKAWTDASSQQVSEPSQNSAWVGGLLTLCLSDVLFRCIGGAVLATCGKRLSLSLHHTMLDHVLYSPVSFFDATPRGRVLNRFSVDLDAVDTRMHLFGKQGIQTALLACGRVVVIAVEVPEILTVAGICAAVFVIGVWLHSRTGNTLLYLEATGVSRAVQHATETMDSVPTIRSYGVTDRFVNHFYRLVDACVVPYYSFTGCYRANRLLAGICSLAVVLGALVISVIVPFSTGARMEPSSVGLVLSSALTIPPVLLLLYISVHVFVQHVVNFERGLEYTELEKEEGNGPLATPGALASLQSPSSGIAFEWPTEGRVEFINYSSSYRPGQLPNTLRGLTFTVLPREKVGVVGRTGAGKSSLVLALLRVLRSTEGCILIDGVDISSVPLQTLRTAITIIPQDPSLMRGSLRDNLDPTGSHPDEEIWDVLGQAHLQELASRHPNKLLLEIADGGSNLSLGERQLVCLARALLRRPKVLLLDEATSQMDGDTDQLIQATLRRSFASCTLLTIAHRIHTILDYDKILVMGGGAVLEYGAVRDLLRDSTSAFSSMIKRAGVSEKSHLSAIHDSTHF